MEQLTLSIRSRVLTSHDGTTDVRNPGYLFSASRRFGQFQTKLILSMLSAVQLFSYRRLRGTMIIIVDTSTEHRLADRDAE